MATIEVFSAGCSLCEETVQLVKRLACPQCDVSVLDMNEVTFAERAKNLGIHAVPSIAINGTLASCCEGKGPDESVLRKAGVGTP